jgi:hypothetical protein
MTNDAPSDGGRGGQARMTIEARMPEARRPDNEERCTMNEVTTGGRSE